MAVDSLAPAVPLLKGKIRVDQVDLMMGIGVVAVLLVMIIPLPAFNSSEWKPDKPCRHPGFINFIEDTRGCLRAVDGAIVIVSALSGVKAETQKIWKYASEFELPRIVFINKMDKENANFSRR